MTVNQRERKDPLVEIAELAEELCDPRQHIERIYRWTASRNRKFVRQHITIQPGLLEQLGNAIQAATVADDNGRRTIPASRPPLLLEALARQIDISVAVNEWMARTVTTNRGTNESNIRALVGTAPRLDSTTQHTLLHDLRRWRSWAAVMSGWALPPYQPHVVCPMPDCGQLGTVRIVLERKTGLCVACGATWDERDGSINLLAAYIEAETSKPHERVPVGSTVLGHGGWSERRTGS